jgi:hypothetical protein
MGINQQKPGEHSKAQSAPLLQAPVTSQLFVKLVAVAFCNLHCPAQRSCAITPVTRVCSLPTALPPAPSLLYYIPLLPV